MAVLDLFFNDILK